MRQLRSKGFLPLAALAIASVALPAQACPAHKPFDLHYITHADAVFAGELVRYERVSGGPGSVDDYGLLTVKVDKVFRGHPTETVQLMFSSSSSDAPESMSLPGPHLFAGTGVSGGPSDPQHRILVLQEPCSSSFILPYSPQDAGTVRFVLNGGNLGELESPAVSQNGGTEDNAPGPVTWGLLALGLVLGLVGAAAAWQWRRRLER